MLNILKREKAYQGAEAEETSSCPESIEVLEWYYEEIFEETLFIFYFKDAYG